MKSDHFDIDYTGKLWRHRFMSLNLLELYDSFVSSVGTLQKQNSKKMKYKRLSFNVYIIYFRTYRMLVEWGYQYRVF